MNYVNYVKTGLCGRFSVGVVICPKCTESQLECSAVERLLTCTPMQ